MGKLIEFCGAPGVGKSTIYRELTTRFSRSSNWLPAHCLYPKVKTNVTKLKSLFAPAWKAYGDLDSRAMINAGKTFIQKYPGFVDACCVSILQNDRSSLNGTDQRFRRISYMYRLIQKVQVCIESPTEKYIIIEEGLINGIGNALMDNKNQQQELAEIEALFKCMPIPEAIIFVEVDLQSNISRLMSRKKEIGSLEFLDNDQLHEALNRMSRKRKIATAMLAEKGVQVLNIDATRTVHENATAIVNFANDLYMNKMHSAPISQAQLLDSTIIN